MCKLNLTIAPHVTGAIHVMTNPTLTSTSQIIENAQRATRPLLPPPPSLYRQKSTLSRSLLTVHRHIESLPPATTRLLIIQTSRKSALYMGRSTSVQEIERAWHQYARDNAVHHGASNLGCSSWMRLHFAFRT